MGNQQQNPRCSSGTASFAAAPFFGEEVKFCMLFLVELGGKSVVALYFLEREGLLQVFFPPLTSGLNAVPFSFGSDMGDHFITPCGACRQVMREVTARVGLHGSFPDARP